MATSPLSQERVPLQHGFYPEHCLRAACDAYREFADINVETGGDSSDVEIIPRSKESEATVRREFLNYVLDLSIKAHLSA